MIDEGWSMCIFIYIVVDGKEKLSVSGVLGRRNVRYM